MTADIATSTPFTDFAFIPVYGIADGKCMCPAGTKCPSPGKHPNARLAPNGIKNATQDPRLLREWAEKNTGGNLAIATGFKLDSIGRYLLVVDVDPRNGGNETLAEIETKFGKLPHTVRTVTGGAGAHYYLWSEQPVACRTIGPGLDLKANNGYVLCEPSNHISGGKYFWDAGAHPQDTSVAQAPDWLLEASSAPSRERPVWNGISAKDTLMGAAFELAGMLGVPLGQGVYAVKCPNAHLHSDGRGMGKDSSSAILPPIPNTHFGGFRCQHSHCMALKWSDVLMALPPAAVSQAKSKYPLKPTSITAKPVAAIVGEPPDIRQLFAYKQTKSGSVIISDIVNVITVLTYDPDWQMDGMSILRFDDFSQQIRFARQPMWFADDMPATPHDTWEDQDTSRLIAYCRRKYDFQIKKDMAYQAVEVTARKYAVHPVREMLSLLVWDGKPRVETWLSKFLGVENTPYSRLVGPWWLVSAVARIMRPGCKADHVLILEGLQGTFKSTALCSLAIHEPYFNDTPFELGSKDSYLALRGKWIVELAELDSLNRSEASRAKAFFSSRADTYRAPYGRETITVPRQCVFAGSVNLEQYLRDETGARRYWPVRCGQVNLDGLRSNAPQLWAESMVLFGQGHRWWPETPEERELCKFEQDDRGEQDAWTGELARWLATAEARETRLSENRITDVTPNGYVTLGDLLSRALKLLPSNWEKAPQIRVGKCMAEIKGWSKVRVLRSGRREYAWSI